ncbi:MAG: hypothetical protein ACREFP_13075, partial [Acetobacteraceae bacterium]
YAVLKLNAADGGSPARIVINQASSRPQGERTHATLARACDAFLGAVPPLAGVIRRDQRVREAIRHQSLLLARRPLSPAALDVEAMVPSLIAPAAANSSPALITGSASCH